MFKKFANGCVKLVEKYLPDPFLFASILTLVVLLLGIFVTDQSLFEMIGHWSGGFWSLLSFSMQMALVLVTGHTLAQTPVIKRGITKLASMPKTPGGAIMMVTFISLIACWINWGFGLVIGALIAKEVARQKEGVDYRLLIASGYCGFLIWHAGFSASIPLTVAGDPVELAKMTANAVTESIPTSQTIFSTYALVPIAIILVGMPFVNRWMHPAPEDTIVVDPKLLEEVEPEKLDKSKMTPADRIENSPIISMLIGAMGLIFVVRYFIQNGFDLNLNIVNFIFLFAGIILHVTPRRFLDAITIAVKGAGGIILQFPFYAGIMGMMTGASAEGVSLAGSISTFFVNVSNTTTFPLFSFLSAGIVNVFVPSGGGQWAVQAPIMMPAGLELGVDPARTAMSIAWGDAWTNLIQPFWALPALGIAGLKAKDIMGFCLVNLLLFGAVIGLCLMFL